MVEVIKVATDQFASGFMIINKSDFDPDTMAEFVEVEQKSEASLESGNKAGSDLKSGTKISKAGK